LIINPRIQNIEVFELKSDIRNVILVARSKFSLIVLR